MTRQPKVAKWEKDGLWHYSVHYEPTESDRKMFPVSYPANDDGPFFVWASESFDTEEQAMNAMKQANGHL